MSARGRARAPLALCLAAALGALGVTACGASGSGSDSGSGANGGDHDGGSAAKLSVHGAYVPQPVDASMAAGYFTVHNSGGRAAELTSVSSGLAHHVQLHTTTKKRQMERAHALKVPAHGELRLARGGSHLMFMGLRKKPVEGSTVTVTLHFSGHRDVRVPMPVRSTTYVPPEKHTGGHGT